MRRTSIISLAFRHPDRAADAVDVNRGLILQWLQKAAEYRPDFVCFSEMCVQVSADPTLTDPMATWIQAAETVPGPTTEVVGEKARELRTHVVLPLAERDGSDVYNSAVLIGRDGAVAGVYRKNYPPIPELAVGVGPGTEVPVWETDRGRVGMAICFDLEFPQVALALARGAADLVFWPSMYEGGRKLCTWARDYGFYVVSCHAGSSAIVDMNGAVLSGAGQETPLASEEGLASSAFAEVNTDRRTYHLDFNEQKVAAVRARYGDSISIELMSPENLFILTSNTDTLTVDEIEEEFELERLRDFLDRSMRLRDERVRTPVSV